ncbi:bifunctional hydroxymethylpyrimidine kinase/phosphomethylpyrimidine kinase [Beggiatoa leptomitoformis]|uniref:hydroxymethylpyrimidine kinase n=1 Tax=Beggiatoa leptomitoformis TaxID=288004 RepID=A0A2N9YEF6_9GAMM|nr:bifunctional hydroxymethylpyrimidine kinase/phosphomethylpyrimidine kinase [Beggiatoa leptomitoformis]ALG68856.1 bifunctional hydroxymethylpyrimidine kinase/phosphomethylpyrimidine kinase [Beggiatoa leptomitoformis]AUI68775.1 bifunctional hydroxymethylpyrimidine kinase/phosphomethylpyrimidine kinase [Beggiatoa leptomitoformis]
MSIINTKYYKRLLTIAGSDSGGGAGVQADLKTFSALGCYGMSVLTALTAQNTREVTAIHTVPVHFIRQQMVAILSDIGVDSIKIGMLHSAEVIETIASTLKEFEIQHIVLDPVMVAKSGDLLMQKDAIEALKTLLIPLATVITPNLPEAEALLNEPVASVPQMLTAAKNLSHLGSQTVLLKGGHLQNQHSIDILYESQLDTFTELSHARIQTHNSHGTGCTLSSAIAAYLAKGCSVKEAVSAAKTYLTFALQAGAAYKMGQGHGPVHHFHQFWD